MIVIDVETSGVNPQTHSLLSIGAVDFENPTNRFYEECRVFPGAHIASEALAINGFSREEAQDNNKQSDGELLLHFLAWAERISEKTIAGHNPSMDRDFMRATAVRHHINWQFAYRTVDLHSVVYAHMRSRGLAIPSTHAHTALSLDATLAYVGLPQEPRPHNGLVGALLETECFSRLFFGKNLLPEYAQSAVPTFTQ